MTTPTFDDLVGTRWRGMGELWTDPLGDTAQRYDCSMHVERQRLSYTWSHEGTTHQGSLSIDENGARWTDSWHQSQPVDCTHCEGDWGLLSVESTYAAGDGPRWGWRTRLSMRPTGQLVLQMTNVAPWGEHARAVRMVFEQDATSGEDG